MMLAIFIFLISIIVLATNIHFNIKSMNDTMKAYVKIGVFYVLIPHHRLLSKMIYNKKTDIIKMKKDFSRMKKLTLNILSHSIIDHIYIAKFSKEELSNRPIENALYMIIIQQIRGLLQSYFKWVDTQNIQLQYDKSYENIDYSLNAHTSIIDLLWAFIQTIIH